MTDGSLAFVPQELIRKKRDGGKLTAKEIEDFCRAFAQGIVADYQMSAMLMAITLKGMTDDETVTLTRVMRDSGQVLRWPLPRDRLVDKHSTGGIGDKTSMIVLPLCLAAGLSVPMIAGRGLGHTGGTLDKLEAVGFDVFPAAAKAREQLLALGGFFAGQTADLAPLDRRLYALRDVTATVESIPLIVGSILSKKLASGIGGLVMDVKYGSGAFIRDVAAARALAQALKQVGEELGLKVRCLLTNMDSPLGRSAGHTLEIVECMDILRGGGPEDTRELSLELATEMVRLHNPGEPHEGVKARLSAFLGDGTALRIFLEIAKAQGAYPEQLLNLRASSDLVTLAVYPSALGSQGGPLQVHACDARALGLAILELGGGRRLVTDKIDPLVGLTGMRHVGEVLAPGQPVAVVHARDQTAAEAAARTVAGAYRVVEVGDASPLPSPPLILERW